MIFNKDVKIISDYTWKEPLRGCNIQKVDIGYDTKNKKYGIFIESDFSTSFIDIKTVNKIICNHKRKNK